MQQDPAPHRRPLAATAAVVALALVPAPGTAQDVVRLPGDDQALGAEARTVYTVGALDGAEWETFSRLDQVAFDGRGNLYVLDPENFRIVVVTPDGTLLREIGHQGGGPGEFQSPISLAVHPDGRVAVFDLGHRGLIYFDENGDFVGQRPVEMGHLPGRDMQFLPDGSLIASGQGLVTVSAGGGPTVPTTRPIRRYPWGESGSISVLHEAWLPPRGGSTTESGAGPIRMVGMPQPKAFEPGFAMGVLPDGRIAYADSVTYAVKLLTPGEGAETVLRRPLEPREVTRRDREREKDRRLSELREGEGPQVRMRVQGSGGTVDVPRDAIRKMLEERVESLEFSEEFPVIADLAVDREGRIWVQRTAGDYQEEGPIDLLSPEGEYLGTIAPEGPRIPDAFGPDGLMAYLETGEFDVPMVVVKRLEPSR